MLTPTQLTFLRQDLIALAAIEYDEVMAELLDHYASLTEQKMVIGMSFDDASKWAWVELDLEMSLKRIQTAYEKSIQQQLRNQHLTIIKSYFHWPTIVATLLLSILLHQLVVLMPPSAITTMFTIVFVSPWFVAWYAHTSWGNRNNNRQKIWRSFLLSYTSIPITIANLVSLLASLFYHTNLFEYIPAHTVAMTTFCIVFALFVASLVQLTREQFHYKLT